MEERPIIYLARVQVTFLSKKRFVFDRDIEVLIIGFTPKDAEDKFRKDPECSLWAFRRLSEFNKSLEVKSINFVDVLKDMGRVVHS
jgi:hypothetical protein